MAARFTRLRRGADLFAVALLSLALAVYWLHRGPPLGGGDGKLHLLRAELLVHDLRAGQFPVRWSPVLVGGYGYPLFAFYAPLAYYALAAARLAGIGLPLAGALLWALLVPGVAFAAFLLGWLLESRSAGSVMAVGGLSMSYCWGLA
ncbi:MAG: hypothetical protein AB7Y46_20275, partial [Armatimonadota bacterium]